MSEKRILIVEDDPDIRLGYHVLLKANNYETYFASDCMMAITEARKARPDLIVLDLGLPAGDGFLVLERLKANTYLSIVPVIVVSGRNLQASKDRALKAGAKAFLQKPWDDKELLTVIGNLLGRTEASAAGAR